MSATLRALIVDDEELARRRIRDLLANHDDIRLIGECPDGRTAIDTIRKDPPDILFLDVQMPELDGFDVLRSIDGSTVPAIVFVTAHERYAVQAFEFVALDYLLKPFDRQRFNETLDRARQRIAERQSNAAGRQIEELLSDLSHKPAARLVVWEGGRISFLPMEEIRWIEAQGNYVKVHAEATQPLLRRSLTDMERRLDPARFLRIHRSTIVNIDRVRQLDAKSHGEYRVTLDDGTRLTTKRGIRETLHERLAHLFSSGND